MSNGEEKVCHKCAQKIAAEESVLHPVRRGYSAKHFPLFHFEKAPFCPECLQRQYKIDVFEKVLAYITLGLVLYFMAMGFIFLFGAGR